MPDIASAPTGTVTITALLRDSETAPTERLRSARTASRQVYAIDTAQVSTAATGVAVAGSYLQLVDNQPGVLGVAEMPHLDPGPFLSYGIQWIAFGIVAPIGLGYFAYSEIRARRREATASAAARRETVIGPGHRRGQARRPLRPTAVRPIATTAAAV